MIVTSGGDIRKSGYRQTGHQENRVSGKDKSCGAADRPPQGGEQLKVMRSTAEGGDEETSSVTQSQRGCSKKRVSEPQAVQANTIRSPWDAKGGMPFGRGEVNRKDGRNHRLSWMTHLSQRQY
jgi:hypothetical protein